MAQVTLKDVASEAGVSIQTASKVLRNEGDAFRQDTQERVWEAVESLGYRPNVSAQNLRTKSSNLLGFSLQMGRSTEKIHPVAAQFQYSAVQSAEANGYHLLTFLFEDNWDVSVYRELYARRQVAGFILADTIYDDPRISYLIEHNVPFASFGRSNPDWDYCWVDVDGGAGLSRVVDHLVERGHERIALISWPESLRLTQEREPGFFSKLDEAGLGFRNEWLIRGANHADVGRAGALALLQLPVHERPTALVCMSDILAAGALAGVGERGLRPGQDIAVTGFDDSEVAAFLDPPLTTVGQPIAEAGHEVVQLLLKQIASEPIEQRFHLLEPTLVLRDTA